MTLYIRVVCHFRTTVNRQLKDKDTELNFVNLQKNKLNGKRKKD
jgi:hypothetical protein